MHDDWSAYAAERRTPHVDYRPLLTMFTAPTQLWTVCRDERGTWCVQRLQDWRCRVILTGAFSLTDERQEEHARDVAACLNRVYAA